MTPLLPEAANAPAFQAVRLDERRLSPGIAAILTRHGLGGSSWARFPDGSLPVYAVGEHRVLKLYPPCYAHELAIERAALLAVDGRLPIPTPAVETSGELEGWQYLLMSRLRGVSAAETWPRLAPRDRDRVVEAVGGALGALHAIPEPPSEVPRPDWSSFLAEQAASAVRRQRARGLEERWLNQIDDFLASTPLPSHPRAALLHTEVMREHLLLEEGADGWRVSGLFDFEPAMVGDAEYEFASVGLFETCGEAGRLRRLLRAYGTPESSLDEDMSRRLLTLALLHRYSNLPWYLGRLPTSATTLAELAIAWWSLDES